MLPQSKFSISVSPINKQRRSAQVRVKPFLLRNKETSDVLLGLTTPVMGMLRFPSCWSHSCPSGSQCRRGPGMSTLDLPYGSIHRTVRLLVPSMHIHGDTFAPHGSNLHPSTSVAPLRPRLDYWVPSAMDRNSRKTEHAPSFGAEFARHVVFHWPFHSRNPDSILLLTSYVRTCVVFSNQVPQKTPIMPVQCQRESRYAPLGPSAATSRPFGDFSSVHPKSCRPHTVIGAV